MLPPLGPDGKPIGPEMLAPVFPMNLIEQEMSTERWIDIPEEILNILYRWRPAPLRRAVYLEKYLDTPAHIYFKDESTIDIEEVYGAASFPNLLGVEGLVPSYVMVKLWPANSGSIVGSKNPFGGTASSFAHIFMLDYGVPVDCPITGGVQTINFHSEVVYNDGISPNGASDVDHDWSNAVFVVSTTFPLAENLSFTPGIYYQASWEDTVNTEDEYWSSLSLTYTF